MSSISIFTNQRRVEKQTTSEMTPYFTMTMGAFPKYFGKSNVIVTLWGVVLCWTFCVRQTPLFGTLLYDTFCVEIV